MEDELDEKAPAPDPQPPLDPEPEPEAPEVDEVPDPEIAPGLEAGKPTGSEPVAPQVEVVAAEEAGVPDFEIAAGPAGEQPAARSYAGWIGLALLSLGLMLLYARRRRPVQHDAASALQSM